LFAARLEWRPDEADAAVQITNGGRVARREFQRGTHGAGLALRPPEFFTEVDMSDLEIGQRVEPAPVCATPRSGMDTKIRAAKIDSARNILTSIRAALIEADRALEKMAHGAAGGAVYAKYQTKIAREMCLDADGLIDQAGE
jgi:hypothetical protein